MSDVHPTHYIFVKVHYLNKEPSCTSFAEKLIPYYCTLGPPIPPQRPSTDSILCLSIPQLPSRGGKTRGLTNLCLVLYFHCYPKKGIDIRGRDLSQKSKSFFVSYTLILHHFLSLKEIVCQTTMNNSKSSILFCGFFALFMQSPMDLFNIQSTSVTIQKTQLAFCISNDPQMELQIGPISSSVWFHP